MQVKRWLSLVEWRKNYLQRFNRIVYKSLEYIQPYNYIEPRCCYNFIDTKATISITPSRSFSLSLSLSFCQSAHLCGCTADHLLHSLQVQRSQDNNALLQRILEHKLLQHMNLIWILLECSLHSLYNSIFTRSFSLFLFLSPPCSLFFTPLFSPLFPLDFAFYFHFFIQSDFFINRDKVPRKTIKINATLNLCMISHIYLRWTV